MLFQVPCDSSKSKPQGKKRNERGAAAVIVTPHHIAINFRFKASQKNILSRWHPSYTWRVGDIHQSALQPGAKVWNLVLLTATRGRDFLPIPAAGHSSGPCSFVLIS